MENHQDELLRLLKKHALKIQNAVLSHEPTGNYYIDSREVTLTAYGLFLTASAILEKMEEKNLHPRAVGGMELGDSTIVSGVILYSHLRDQSNPLGGFLVRRQPKKYGLKKQIEGRMLQKGTPVVILDDICTSGKSILKAISVVSGLGWTPIGVVCLVDREEGGGKLVSPICPFHSIFRGSELLSIPERNSKSSSVS